MKISDRGILAVNDGSSTYLGEDWMVIYIPPETETAFFVGLTLSDNEVKNWANLRREWGGPK